MSLLQDLVKKEQKDVLRNIKEMARQTFHMIGKVMLKSNLCSTKISYFFFFNRFSACTSASMLQYTIVQAEQRSIGGASRSVQARTLLEI